MSQLLQNICGIIGTFEKYAKKDGDCSSLNKVELKQLIQREFADVIVNPNDPQTIESVLQLLDTDTDGKVDFEEFTVLVFRVVRACYKKTQECQSPSEGRSKKGEGSRQKTQDEQAPGKETSYRPAQEPQAPKELSGCHPTAESQKPSQEQKQEPPKSGGQACQTPKQKQDSTHQMSQEPSGMCPGQNKIQGQQAKQDPTQVAQRLQQDCTQESQTIRDSRPQGTQECKIPNQGPTQEPQISEQRTTQQPAQEHRGQRQAHICQGEVESRKPGQQQQPSCQPAHQEEQHPSQREAQRSQRGQQEGTSMKPQGSWVTDQSPSGRQVQEPQDPGQRQGCQAQVHPKPQVGVPQQVLNRQQWESLTQREHLAEQKECQSQGSNQTPTCHPERKPDVPQQTTSGHQECDGSLTSVQQFHQWDWRPQNQEQISMGHPEGQSHAQERRPPNPDQTPTCREEREPRVPQQTTSSHQEHGPWTSEQQPRQEECRPQNPGQAPTCRPEQEHQVPQQDTAERASSIEGRCYQQQRVHQKSEECQFCYSECEPLSSEQGFFPQDQRASQARESHQSCDPAEVTQEPNDSSTRKPLKASWPASHQKPLQFPSPWVSKQ